MSRYIWIHSTTVSAASGPQSAPVRWSTLNGIIRNQLGSLLSRTSAHKHRPKSNLMQSRILWGCRASGFCISTQNWTSEGSFVLQSIEDRFWVLWLDFSGLFRNKNWTRIYLNIFISYSYSLSGIWIWYATDTIQTGRGEYNMDMNTIEKFRIHIIFWPALLGSEE
jgi:hypothetical protein